MNKDTPQTIFKYVSVVNPLQKSLKAVPVLNCLLLLTQFFFTMDAIYNISLTMWLMRWSSWLPLDILGGWKHNLPVTEHFHLWPMPCLKYMSQNSSRIWSQKYQKNSNEYQGHCLLIRPAPLHHIRDLTSVLRSNTGLKVVSHRDDLEEITWWQLQKKF